MSKIEIFNLISVWLLIFLVIISLIVISSDLEYVSNHVSFKPYKCECKFPEVNVTEKDCYTTEEIVRMQDFQYAVRELR